MTTNKARLTVIPPAWVALRDIEGAPPAASPATPLPFRSALHRIPFVLLTPGPPHGIQVGYRNLRRARALQHSRVRARIEPQLGLSELQVRAAEAGDLAARIEVVGPLRAAGLADPEIAELFAVDKAQVWRWRKLAGADGVRDALLSGRISDSHSRYLLGRSPQEQAYWLERTLQAQWTVAELAAAQAGAEVRAAPSSPTATQGAGGARTPTEVRLQAVLNADTRLQWDGKAGELTIQWFGIADLQSILERLGQGNADPKGLPNQARRLRIPFVSLEEFEALVQHLGVGEGDG